ncbi:MAG: carboxypeptidase-like regulatory domain-containing protein, partial [Flavisolibacter sp.]
MRILYRFVLLVLASTLLSQCQRELSYVGTGDPGQVVLPSPLTANLQGNVLDENGQPAANVVITVGAQITATDTKGYFRINNASLDKNTALVTADKTGYFTAYRSFSATSGTNQVVIKLTKKNLGGTVNGVNGGDVTLSNGTKISLPANGIVKASDNSIYTGTVNIYAAFIDPTSADILDKVPGSFMGNDKDGKRVILSSYGMMAVVLESTAGEKLQVKSGSTATLTSPIPSAAQASAPATIPLWYVDETTGIWKEEGTATRQGNSYVGTVKHFTYWNCDIPVQTVNLSATFKTPNGQPLVNASIVIKPTTGSYYGSAHGYTDSLGQMNGPVPAKMELVLQVFDGCNNPVYSQNIGPYSEPVNLGTITIPSTTPALVTVKG